MKLIDLPCFVINLKERTERWEKMKNGLKIFNNVSRIDAINVKNMELSKLPISLFTRYIIEDKNARRSHHFQLHTKGAVGCALSHIKCWKKIVDDDIKEAIIFEDDCDIEPGIFTHIQDCYEKFDKDIFIFGYIGLFNKKILNSCFSKAESYMGAHAYLLTKEGAKTLLTHSLPIELHLDAYISLMIYNKYLQGLYITDGEIKQNKELGSDIQADNHECKYCIYPGINMDQLIQENTHKDDVKSDKSNGVIYIFLIILVIIITVFITKKKINNIII